MSLLHYIKYVGDKGYVVKREMPKYMFAKDNQIRMDWLAAFRDYINCDHVLQSESHFIFCETIQDAEIIEEKVYEN
jgi:hypothetical protein